MNNNIFFKAKNSIGDIVTTFVVAIIVIVSVYYVSGSVSTLPFAEQFSNVLNITYIVLDLLCVANFIFALVKYKYNSLAITTKGIDVKVGFRHDFIHFEDLKNFKKEYSISLNLVVTAKVVIYKKNGREIKYPDIRNFNEFAQKIKEIYPTFSNLSGLLQNLTNQVILSVVAMLVVYSVYDVIIALKTYIPQSEGIITKTAGWLQFSMIIIGIWLVVSVYLRFFFPPTKSMIKKIKDEKFNSLDIKAMLKK